MKIRYIIIIIIIIVILINYNKYIKNIKIIIWINKYRNTNIENIDIYKLGAPFATSSATKGNYEIDSVSLENIHQKMKDGGGALFIYQESSANITITK